MGDVKLATPRVRVVMGDDTVHEVQVINADMLRYEATAPGQKWGAPDKGYSLTWMTFCAWAALKRTKTIDASVTWEQFRDSTQEVASVDDEQGREPDAVDPSLTEAEAG